MKPIPRTLFDAAIKPLTRQNLRDSALGPVHRALVMAHDVKVEVTSSVGARAKRGRKQRLVVNPLEVDAAVEAWGASETPEQAVRRHGVSAPTMRRWLEQAGHAPTKPHAPWRVLSSVIDEVVAARGRRGTARRGVEDANGVV